MQRASVTVTISNEQGLHARPAGVFAAIAEQYHCTVTVTRTDNGQTAEAISILTLLPLTLLQHDEIRIDAAGEDAEAAVAALAQLVRDDFRPPAPPC